MVRTVRRRLCPTSLNRGFLLIEMMLSLMILSALAMIGLSTQVEDLRDLRAVNQSKAMATLQYAQNSYITVFYNELLNGLPVKKPDNTLVANPMKPTIDELIALNVGLSTTFNKVASNDGNYQVTIDNVAGQLEAKAWIDKPFLTPDGTADLARLGLTARAIGPDAGFSSTTNPHLYKTLSMAAAGPNPAGSVAGILVVRSGYNTQSMQAFLRRDGTLPMTGPLNMGARSIDNADDITAAGTMAADIVNGNSGTINALKSTTINTTSLTGATGTITTLTSGTLATGSVTNSGSYTGAGNIKTTADLEAANMTAGGVIKSNSVETSSLSATGNLKVTGQAEMGSQKVNGNQVITGNTTVTGALVPGLIASGGGFCGANPGAIARDASNNLYICN